MRIATSASRSVLAGLAAGAITLGLALPAAAANRDRPVVVVLPATGRGVSSAFVEQARGLLVFRLMRRPGLRVLDYAGPPTAYPVAPGPAAELAEKAGADLALAFDVSHEGTSTTFDLICYEVATGRPACHIREATTAGPEVLPSLSDWLANRLESAIGGVRVAVEPIAVARATPSAAWRPREPPRERALTVGARVQLALPVASPATDVQVLGGFGVLLALDSGFIMSSLALDLFVGNESTMRSATLSVFAPLSDQRLMPYIGAGVGLVDQKLGGRGATGGQVRPTLGVLWGRHEMAKARLEIAYFVDLFEELPEDRLRPSAGIGHVAHGVTLSTGATF